jgi:glutaredoxin
MSEYIKKVKSFAEENWKMLLIFLVAVAAVVAYSYYNNGGIGGIGGIGGSASTKSLSALSSSEPTLAQVKSYDIHMFYDPANPAAALQIETIKDYAPVISFVDMTTEAGAATAKTFHIPPENIAFVSAKYGTGVKIGENTTMKQLLHSFDSTKAAPVTSSNPDAATIKALDIVLVTKEGCGHCTQAKKRWEESGLSNQITLLPSESEDGQKIVSKYKFNGFPSYFSQKTNKTAVGNKPISTIVKELS